MTIVFFFHIDLTNWPNLTKFLHARCNFLPAEELPPNYHPTVVNVYKFGQEIFTIGTFWNFLKKYPKKVIPVKFAENAFLQQGKIYMQSAQIKIHPDKIFLQHAKI